MCIAQVVRVFELLVSIFYSLYFAKMVTQSSIAIQDVDERLVFFVTTFVEIFEAYFTEFYQRLVDRVPKSGKTANLFNEVFGMAKSGTDTFDEVSKAGTLLLAELIIRMVGKVGADKNRQKVKKLSEKLFEFKQNPELFTDNIISEAGKVFAVFEAQFMNVNGQSGWKYCIRKIAEDAVCRAVSWLRDQEDSSSISIISKGVILGESKCYSLPSEIGGQKGHSLKLKGQRITSADLFEKTGLISDGKYYALRRHKHSWAVFIRNKNKPLLPTDDGVWFRRALEWESPLNDNNYTKVQPPTNVHVYLLEQQHLHEQLENIKRNRGKGNSEEKEFRKSFIDEAKTAAKTMIEYFERNRDEFKTLFVETQMKVEETLGNTQETLRKSYEATQKICKKLDDAIKSNSANGRDPPDRIWTVEQPIPYFHGRESELKELNELILRQVKVEVSYLSRVTVISGLGGVGKTQLAKKYAHTYKDSFYDAVWIEAEDKSSLTRSFTELAANRCGIPTKNVDGETKDIKSVVQDVFRFFNGRGSSKSSLVILDNADDPEAIIDFLPICEPEESKTYILITSTDNAWFAQHEHTRIWKLEGFNDADANAFLKKRLGIKDDDNDDEILILAHTLENFPLALEQAVAYIADERNTNKNYSVSTYLNEYSEKSNELLSDQTFQSPINKYRHTTYTTWQLSFNKISNDVTYGKLAEKILNIMSVISPDLINREMFFHLEGVEEKDVQKAIGLIVRFSMAKPEDDVKMLSVHRLVQEVTRSRIEKGGITVEILEEAIGLIRAWGSRDNELTTYIICFFYVHSVVSESFKWFERSRKSFNVIRTLIDLGKRAVQCIDSITDIAIPMELAENYRPFLWLPGAPTFVNPLRITLERIGLIEPHLLRHNKKYVDDFLSAEYLVELGEFYRCGLYDGPTCKELLRCALAALGRFELHNLNKPNDLLVLFTKLKIYNKLCYVDDHDATVELLKDTLDQIDIFRNEIDQDGCTTCAEVLREAYTNVGDTENQQKYLKKSGCSGKKVEVVVENGVYRHRIYHYDYLSIICDHEAPLRYLVNDYRNIIGFDPTDKCNEFDSSRYFGTSDRQALSALEKLSEPNNLNRS